VSKRLIVGISVALLAATATLVAAGSHPVQKVAANDRDDGPIVERVYVPRHGSEPHIIHVPDNYAPVRRRAGTAPPDEYVAPPSRRVQAPLESQNRPSYSLTPIYPTPNFGAKTAPAEKFAAPAEPAPRDERRAD
jgi:hypothetical protein